MKRPLLISSVIMAVSSLALVKLFKITPFIILGLGVAVFILYFIKPLKLKKHIVLPLIGVSLVLISLSFMLFNSYNINPYLEYNNKTTYIAGKVISQPQKLNNSTRFILKAEKIGEKNVNTKVEITLNGKIRAPELFDFISIDNADITIPQDSSGGIDYKGVSDGVLLNGKAKSINNLWNADRNIYYYLLKLKISLCEKLDCFLGSGSAGLLKAMLFGDKSQLNDEIYSSFRGSGLAHILAVSGLHTTMWCSLILSIFKFCKLPEKAGNIFCIIFLMGFCILAAFSPSVIRASLMMLLVLTGVFFKRQSDSLNSLGFAVVVLLLQNPYIILNLSFQLSCVATLGAILGLKFQEKAMEKIAEIKNKHLKAITKFVVSTLLMSGFIVIFTLPLSAYYFGVFSIIAPISNLLCVKLCFYGMTIGLLSTLISFIPFVSILADILFKVTNVILTLVVDLAKSLSSFKYATLPIHKEFLTYGFILCVVFIAIGYILYKVKGNIKLLKGFSVLGVGLMCVVLSFPIIMPQFKNQVTILSAGDELHLVVRSGLNYAYISNGENPPKRIFDYLPKASSESLVYFKPTDVNFKNAGSYSRIASFYKPAETLLSPKDYEVFNESEKEISYNIVIGSKQKLSLSPEISLEIFDTYTNGYAIIRSSDKTILVNLRGKCKYPSLENESFDAVVYLKEIPSITPIKGDDIILSSGSEYVTENNLTQLESEDFHSTAYNGDITINI